MGEKLKLTDAIRRAIVRCEEEINAERMGEQSATPDLAFAALLQALDLDALLAAARAEERELCIKDCIALGRSFPQMVVRDVAERCADAIRARGEGAHG